MDRVKLMYSPKYDCLMIIKPIYPKSHWYKFEGDPWEYGGCAAHKMDFLTEIANFEIIDKWEE
jgi:hypothetical protein